MESILNGLQSGTDALRTSEHRLQVAAANLANLSTPAFKRRSVATHAFVVATQDGLQEVVTTSERVDFEQGPLRRTGNPLDLALDGAGFFGLEAPDGEVYTRQGTFLTDEGGVLVSHDGFPVAWEGGRGRIDPTGEEIFVDGSGEVRQGGISVGRLRIANFADEQALELTAEGNYRVPLGTAEVPHEATVHQGAIEESNVQSIDELVELIRIQRNFESASNLMRMIRRSYEQLIEQQ
jgi:flagellar basal-body rod protein FlgG